MHRRGVATALLLAVVVAPVLPANPSGAAVAADPVHDIAVVGADAGVYPAFDEAVPRYAITTGPATNGTVTITATSSDPGHEIRVNGVPAADGTRTVTGLDAGDEIAVFIEDSAGAGRYSFVYLPSGFPSLERVTPDSTLDQVVPGHVLLTLGLFTAPSSFYETAVDVNGVPAFVRARPHVAIDLQLQPNGSYSVYRPTAEPGRSGWDLLELGPDHQLVRTWRTTGLVNTDSHDAILLPDGTAWLMAYEPNPGTGLVDSVVQHLAADGTLLFSWSSAAYAGETTVDPGSGFGGDYAHINSFQVLPDGHLLASFRHLSSVFKIATHDDGPYAAGEVIWKLGGRDSDFTFPPGDVGPCAQHTARMLPDGNVVLFDNGSWAFNDERLCVDPADPTGPSVAREYTRVVELELDEATWTATPVATYEPAGRFALFAGSSQPLPNGSTVIGWASDTQAVASELNPAGELVWEIRDPGPGARYFTYRAHKAVVADVVPPEISVAGLPDGGSYVEGAPVPVAYECTDRGGSGLQTCTGSVDNGGALDTTGPGDHTFTVTATDGSGGTTTETRTYTILPASRPDAAVRAKGRPEFRGVDVYGGSGAQRARVKVDRPGGRSRAIVRLTNNGAEPDRLTLEVRNPSPRFRASGGCASVTRTPVLAPGESWVCRLTLTRRPGTDDGRRTVIRIPVRSLTQPFRSDVVSVEVRAT